MVGNTMVDYVFKQQQQGIDFRSCAYNPQSISHQRIAVDTSMASSGLTLQRVPSPASIVTATDLLSTLEL